MEGKEQDKLLTNILEAFKNSWQEIDHLQPLRDVLQKAHVRARLLQNAGTVNLRAAMGARAPTPSLGNRERRAFGEMV